MAADMQPMIIVRKKRRAGSAHHGGAWKVAYADFVTAMMAFFMVMWLSATMSQEQLGGIADYFKNPGAVEGKSTRPAPGVTGPGGAGDSPITMFDNVLNPPGAGPSNVEVANQPRKSADQKVPDEKSGNEKAGLAKAGDEDKKLTAAELRALDEKERKKLKDLKRALEEAIASSQALAPFKDQLLIDITPEGLRIQIVDALNRPMFDVGSPRLRGYTSTILIELSPYLNRVENRVALSGHTDTRPYQGEKGYSNWELSADRANAARRALVAGGLEEGKLARVVGLSSSVPFLKNDPGNPINRRISIVVLNQAAERAAAKTDQPQVASAGVDAQKQNAASPLANAASTAEPVPSIKPAAI